MKESWFCMAFSSCDGVGPIAFSRLLKVFQTAEKAYTAPASELKKALLPAQLATFLVFRKQFPVEKEGKRIEKNGIHIITRNNPFFPQSLLYIHDVPICLFAIGNVTLLRESDMISIVGTRGASSYGIQVTKTFGKALARAGMIVVSGMAVGIDSVAHSACLEEGGKTIAVLGCGVDIIYPYKNRKLYQQIISSQGLVLSEYPPGRPPMPAQFVQRNRLISGLSKGVLVVEGSLKSGSMITAGFAAEQNKDLFVVPMPLHQKNSEGPIHLYKNGGRMVTDPVEIMDEYGISPCVSTVNKPVTSPDLSPLEQSIILKLQVEPLSVSALVEQLRVQAQEVMSSLSLLELKGIIQNDKGDEYYVS